MRKLIERKSTPEIFFAEMTRLLNYPFSEEEKNLFSGDLARFFRVRSVYSVQP